jgi:hypothetical protein
MTDQQSGSSHLQTYAPTYHSAANPYSSGISGQGGFSGGYSSYGSLSPYGGMGGIYGGYGYGYNSMPGDHLWQGFLGHTAETLGRLNNLLSMTGMLVEHISNHGRLIYSKGVEVHSWYNSLKTWTERHSEWMEKLGLQVESSWKTNENEPVRRRRMMVRRVRTIIIMAFIGFVIYFAKKRRSRTRKAKWDSIYHSQAPLVRRVS